MLCGAFLHIQREFGHGGGGVAAAVHWGGARVAGHANDLAHKTHTAVDGGDDAQREVELVEHGALLDVHFNKAYIVSCVAREFGNVFDLQACLLHGLAQGDAIGIVLVEPLGFEIAHQSARAQEGGFVALAFFFGKTHHFEVEGQSFASTRQFTHTSHGHEDTQAAVVFATIAHRVVMRTGHQGFGACGCGFVNAHHIAHGVDTHVIEATGFHA